MLMATKKVCLAFREGVKMGERVAIMISTEDEICMSEVLNCPR
jgi:hypothetical protein